MTLEEKLIADFLKKNKPTVIDEKYSHIDIYGRAYIKEVKGKCCGYCGETLNEDNTFIKVTNKPRKVEDIVICKRCSIYSDSDKDLLSKMGHKTFLLIKELEKKLKIYIEKRNVTKAELRTKINKLKNSTESYTFYKVKAIKREEALSKYEHALELHNITTQVHIDNEKERINSFINNNDFVLEKHLIDYTKFPIVKDEENNYDD